MGARAYEGFVSLAGRSLGRMTGRGETGEANERTLVRSTSDGFLRQFLPDPWPELGPESEPGSTGKRDTGAEPHRTRDRAGVFWRVAAGLRAMPAWMAAAFDTEIGRGVFFLLFPVAAGCGAVIYFTLSFEPDWTPVLVVFALLAAARFLARRHFFAAQLLTLCLAFQLGLAAGKWETQTCATPMLGSDVATRVTGRVVALEYQDNGSWRITLDLLRTERPRLHFAPKRVRINARDIPADTAIGGGLTGYARLRVPSGPVRPGNYDFAFHAYFSGLGANGFFLGTPASIAVPPPENLSARISGWIAILRTLVAERIEEVIGGEDGNVAAALIAGARAGISNETNENLRKAGLAHILSISGLHLALAAGVVMLTLRAGFALFPGFSARHPVKKYAAFLSLLSCTFYLAMSGADVAAQRSYVMIAVMLLALLADRAAISMRNLAIAAIAMILLSPHEISGPSFQMSFSATAALIAAFGWWSERNAAKHRRGDRRERTDRGFLAKALVPAVSTAGTSLVAGIASGIFAAYHFNNTAPLGLVGNVLALPAISLLVMPFAVFGLVLMPLGLDWLPLQIMGFGIWAVRHIAAFVAAWSPDGNPGAMPIATLILWTTALLAAVIFTTRLRLLALPFVVVGLVIFWRTPFPDIVISEDAKLVGVRRPDGRMALNRGRPSKFIAENWRTSYLVTDFIEPPGRKDKNESAARDGFICEEGLCTITLRDGRTLAYTADPAVAEIACTVGDVAILAVPDRALSCEDAEKLVVTRRDLALMGTVEIRLSERSAAPPEAAMDTTHTPNELSHDRTAAVLRRADRVTYAIGPPTRPWELHRLYSRAARGLPDRPPRKSSRNHVPQQRPSSGTDNGSDRQPAGKIAQ